MSSNELMYMNWREMIKPEKVQVSSTQTYGKFVCEPLERGYGTTLGIRCVGLYFPHCTVLPLRPLKSNRFNMSSAQSPAFLKMYPRLS